MSRWIVLLLAGLVALSPGRAMAQGPRPLTVPVGEVVHGDLAALDQPIVIAGVVEGDVTSWSGAITVLGEVRGDVVSYAGAITLGPAAQVQGSVLSLGGGVMREGQAQVAGQTLGQQPLAGGRALANAALFLQPQRDAPVTLPLALISAAMALMALFLATMCAAVWPMRTQGVSMALRRAPARAAAFGLLTTALFALLLLPLSGLFALSLVGLPLLLPLAIVIQAPYLFGLAGLGRALGERVRPDAPHALAAPLGIALLLLPLGLVGMAAPVWGLLLYYAAASVGLGAAILSRGGAYALRA